MKQRKIKSQFSADFLKSEWDETKHPRDEGGKFSSSGGSGPAREPGVKLSTLKRFAHAADDVALTAKNEYAGVGYVNPGDALAHHFEFADQQTGEVDRIRQAARTAFESSMRDAGASPQEIVAWNTVRDFWKSSANDPAVDAVEFIMADRHGGSVWVGDWDDSGENISGVKGFEASQRPGHRQEAMAETEAATGFKESRLRWFADHEAAFHQALVRKAYGDSITLYRGVSNASGRPGTYRTTRTNGISSWSTDRETADTFGHTTYQMRVPTERVFSSFLGGFGVSGEFEVLVIGSKRDKVKIVRADMEKAESEADFDIDADPKDRNWLRARVTKAEWSEELHPRDEGGKFSGGQGSGAAVADKPASQRIPQSRVAHISATYEDAEEQLISDAEDYSDEPFEIGLGGMDGNGRGTHEINYPQLVDALEKSDIDVNRGINGALGVLESGEFKTAYNTDKGREDRSYMDMRRGTEERRFGEATPDAVYGAVAINRELEKIDGFERVYDGATAYGPVKFVLKPEVASRTTYTYGDSFADDAYSGTYSSRQGLAARTLLDHQTGWGGPAIPDYYEAQIHGGVKVSDIARISIRTSAYIDRMDSQVTKIKELAAKYGIPVEVK